MKILIIGGVAGGATAAARLRRNDETAQIVLIERGPYISFANCGLPHHISGTIAERSSLLVTSEALFEARYAVDVRSRTEAIRPKLPGIGSQRVFVLRNIPDLDRLMAHLQTTNPRRAVVIGGGYIGIEMAENLHERGLSTTLVEGAPHILAPFDDEMAAIVHAHMKDKNIELYLGDKITQFEDKADHTVVFLGSGKRLPADVVVLAVGVRPANRQGRIAADNMLAAPGESPKVYKGTLGTAILKAFDLAAACTGLNEIQLQANGIDYRTTITHSGSHASYYPGAKQLSLKLMRKVMRDKGVATPAALLADLVAGGAQLIACQMSMDVMGIRHEELIDGVQIGGVAAFLGEAQESGTTLFI